MKNSILCLCHSPRFLAFQRYKLFAALAALLMLTSMTPAYAATFFLGNLSTTGVPSGGLRADFSRGSKFTLAETATITDFCAFLDGEGGGSGSQSVRIAFYRDANGVPGAKVAESVPQTITAGAQPTSTCFVTADFEVSPGDYWIMLHSGENASVVRYYYDASANWYGGADTFADGAAATFGPGAAGNGTLVVVAQYTFTTFGRRTVGTIASGGLRADFSRGSKFTFNGGATLKELCAYLDGQGGGSGSQSVRLVLYRDANGVPGTKVGASASQMITAGAAPGWKCLPTPYFPINPGAYWIMLQSGDNAGVARYYYDGPANWYGGADAFADDAADTFGPGSAGSGTLSVYARHAYLGTAGRTTVGATPSGGLRANYRRGSAVDYERGRAVALAVYMDGLGGGAGSSQEVAFALYNANWNSTTGTDTPTQLLFVTKPVTIPAGMRPQWITVPLPPHPLDEPAVGVFRTAWLVIHSGSNAGIARYYYDDSSFFCAHADVFSDGTDQSFGNCEHGNGSISAFLSYEYGRFGAAAILGNQADPSTARPSSGLSANFIRGSKFTVTTEDAALGTIHAFMDGLGGGTGSQQVQALVYDDSPEHKLVGQSEIITLTAGTQLGWILFRPKEPALLPLGNYYLTLFTSGNAGVARNYGTPTPNWIGVGANFAAGPPATLNPPPGTGDVTLLMYADLLVPEPEPY